MNFPFYQRKEKTMSEVVHYTGKIKLVEKLQNESLEEQCKRILSQHNFYKKDSYCDSWETMLYEELYDKYVVVNDNLYEVVEKNDKEYDTDIFNIFENEDGSYNYEVMFYNAGCSFSEAIGIALNNINK